MKRLQRKGPLRKIVETIRFADDTFGANRVRLECGHEVRSNGIYSARCSQCAKSLPSPPEGGGL